MERGILQSLEENSEGFFLNIGSLWSPQEVSFQPGGLFASVGRVGMGFGIPSMSAKPINTDVNIPHTKLYSKYMSATEWSFSNSGMLEFLRGEVVEEEEERVVQKKKKNKKGGLRLKLKIGNPSLRRLISGAIAGAVSRTVVAPLETIRTLVMVGNCGNSSAEVFQNIMKSDGWTGFYRGNFVNVIRVAPNKAIELFAYDTVKKVLTPKPREDPIVPLFPASSVAGAIAGVTSTLCTYPLELLKTRLTVQRGVHKNFLDAFVKIVREEGSAELYRGLTPTLIGVIPYAATNYFAYDTLRKAYRKAFKQEEIGNVMTLLIGSASGAFSSTVTFPLEVARKHMQAGALNGRHYKNMLHALTSILEHEGFAGLYKGLGPSCMKIVPAAGISFMCYEACKRILIEKEENAERLAQHTD